MKILNLVDLEKSDIKYKINKFPDGQQQLIITNLWDFSIHPEDREFVELAEIQIKSRMINMEDVGLIICATQSLKQLDFKRIHLYVPYFLGSRSDRQFEEGSNNYLKHVICPIINSQGYNSVTVLDPHSHVLEACLNNFKCENNNNLVKFAFNDLDIKYKSNPNNTKSLTENLILVSPDAGASHKIYKTQEYLKTKKCNLDIVTCSKERDENGKLTKCVVPNIESIDLNKDIIIIDDIFDYGKTFTNISAVFNDADHKGKKYLIITHSIQSDGLHNALKWFDSIYTTNSIKEHNIPKVQQLNIF